MKKALTVLSLLAVFALSASALAQPHKVKWKREFKDHTDVYFCKGIEGDFLAKTTYQGNPILSEGKAFKISITTTTNANNSNEGFSNGYGTGILSTINPYDPDKQKADKQFGIYVGNNRQNLDGYLDHRMVQLRINENVYPVSNYALNHKNDGFQSMLTLSFSMKYTPAREGNKSKIVLTANKGSDVTFDPLVIEDITTSVLFERLQNGGDVSTPPGAKTDLRIAVESDRMVISTAHYVLGGLSAAALLALCMAFTSGKKKKKKKQYQPY